MTSTPDHYGVFVRISPGLDVLVHSSEIPDDLPPFLTHDAVELQILKVDADAGLISSTFVRRLSSMAETRGLEEGSLARGQVIGRDASDVLVDLVDEDLRAKLSRAELAAALEGLDDFPDGCEIVGELPSWPAGGPPPRLALREILGKAYGRYRGLNGGIEDARRIFDVSKSLWQANAVTDQAQGAPDHRMPATPQKPNQGLDPLRSRSGFVVSPQVLSARYGIERSDVEQIFRCVTGRECPNWSLPLELDDAKRVVDTLESHALGSNRIDSDSPEVNVAQRETREPISPERRPGTSGNEPRGVFIDRAQSATTKQVRAPTQSHTDLDPLRSRSGSVVSLHVLSARYGIERLTVEQLFRRVTGRKCPNWSLALELDDARRMVDALEIHVPSSQSFDSDSPKADVTQPGTQVPISPEQRFGTSSDEERADLDVDTFPGTPRAQPGPVAPETLPRQPSVPPIRAPEGGSGSGVDSVVPRYHVLRDLLSKRGTESGDEDDHDSVAVTEQAISVTEVWSPEAIDDSELQEIWIDWLVHGREESKLIEILFESSLSALGNLINSRIPAGEFPAPEFALTELAAAARSVPGAEGAVASPLDVDRILRCLAAIPNDVLPWTVLCRAVPSSWLLTHWERVERWAREQHAREPMEIPSMGRYIAVARAARRQGELKLAHRILCEWLRHADSIDFRQERKNLAEEYRHNILAKQHFFDRWSRRLGFDIGRGSFALVLPVIDKQTGEPHALKHALLLDAISNDQRASDALFDREARLLQDLLGVEGIPRFVARPSDEALVCDWIDGRTLAEMLGESGSGSNWDTGDVVRLGYRLGSVFAAIDQRLPGFVHNDLAPRNLMLPDGRPEAAVLIDLGLAAHANHSVLTLVDELDLDLRATYQAPEVRNGLPGTTRGDMYSLGLVLLEYWLQGKSLPSAPPAVQDALLRKVASSIDSNARRLGQLLGRLLESEPDRRPSGWNEVTALFAEILHE